jgi:drug/metabolite transporter (DMT)-like permease
MRCSTKWCTADPGSPSAWTSGDSGSAAHHFVLRCALETWIEAYESDHLRPPARGRRIVSLLQLARVVFWMTGTLVSFSVMAVSVRVLFAQLTIAEILVIRAAVGLVLLGALGAVNRRLWRDISLRRFPLHLLRNCVHVAAQYLWVLAIVLLPLATVFALEFTMPAHTALLAALFLGERMTPSRIGVIVFGFIGVLVILRPGLESFRPAALMVLFAAFGFAFTMIFLKKLMTSESGYAVVFWMSAMQLPLTLAASNPANFLSLGAQDAIPVLAMGVCGLSAHFCLAKAFREGDASLVVPLDFMRVPLIALVGWWLYAEPLDAYVFAGVGIILAGILWNLRAEAKSEAVVVPARALPEE